MSTSTQNKILFVAGGTGGHIFPALSVYNLFKNINTNLYFATDQRGVKFEEVSNNSTNDPYLHDHNLDTPYLLKLKKVPRRFVTRVKPNS